MRLLLAAASVALAVLAVSTAGVAFGALPAVPPLALASWRMQSTSAILAVGVIFGLATRGGAGDEAEEPRRAPGSNAALPGFGGPANDANEETVEDVQVWHKDGNDEKRT